MCALTFEISFFSSGSLFSSLFDHFFGLFALALAAVALAVAAITLVALTLASALAIDVAFAAFACITAKLAQQILCPSNDLVAVSSDNIHYTGNSSQSSQNLQNDRQNLHKITSYKIIYSTY